MFHSLWVNLSLSVLLLFGVAVAENPPTPSPDKPISCVIVKHKGTVGRRLLWTALIGVPIAPGSKYDLVDSINYPAAKMNYKGKELEAIQKSGTHVVVLDNKYTAEQLEVARKSCKESQAPTEVKK